MNYATLLTLLLTCPVIVLGLEEGGKTSAAGPPPAAESSIEPEAKDKVTQGESAPGSNPPPSPPQSGQGQAQAGERPGAEVCEEADILEEELPVIKEGGGEGPPPQADGRPGGTTTGKR